MAGIAHLGIGLAFKLLLPDVSVIVLVFCSYLIDLLFLVFMFAGLEDMPSSEHITDAPWSHSLLMATIWSILTILTVMLLSQDSYTSIIIGLLVFSHWVIDFIVSPMTHAFPNDTGKLLHPFGKSPKVGLGVMKTKTGVIIIEGGSLIIGGAIFISTLV
ncbi:MAG: hypothetical protein ACW97Z_14595 [Candidatus Hodarchaeales archaeon]|jgi:hypothetical protein